LSKFLLLLGTISLLTPFLLDIHLPALPAIAIGALLPPPLNVPGSA